MATFTTSSMSYKSRAEEDTIANLHRVLEGVQWQIRETCRGMSIQAPEKLPTEVHDLFANWIYANEGRMSRLQMGVMSLAEEFVDDGWPTILRSITGAPPLSSVVSKSLSFSKRSQRAEWQY